MKKVLFFILAAFTVLFGVAAITLWSLNKPLPLGKQGPEAEALRAKIEKTIHKPAWDQTAAVSFIFSKLNNKHFRDKKRDLVEVVWGEDPQFKVQYSNADRSKFLAWSNGQSLSGEDVDNLLAMAVKHHTNDYFWLNPYSMLQAPGTVRRLVGEQALLVTFESGGVTPGDSYLIITDEQGLPQRLQMWVKILPIQGLEWLCNDWQTTETGAKLNVSNKGGILTIGLENVKTWANYPDKKEDRFAKLLPLL